MSTSDENMRQLSYLREQLDRGIALGYGDGRFVMDLLNVSEEARQKAEALHTDEERIEGLRETLRRGTLPDSFYPKEFLPWCRAW